jgi:disulfide isomerase
VNRAREYMAGYPPSSPSMGLFKDGQQVFMLQRLDLQQMDDQQVALALKKAFDEHCAKRGPSVDAETFRKLQPYRGCGSQIPLTGAGS